MTDTDNGAQRFGQLMYAVARLVAGAASVAWGTPLLVFAGALLLAFGTADAAIFVVESRADRY